jgi:hypothetical protein
VRVCVLGVDKGGLGGERGEREAAAAAQGEVLGWAGDSVLSFVPLFFHSSCQPFIQAFMHAFIH